MLNFITDKALLFKITIRLGIGLYCILFPSLICANTSSQITNPEYSTDEEEFESLTERYDIFEDEENIHNLPYLKDPNEIDTSNRDWWYLLKHGSLNINDTTVHYPKFINFCVKVYRWADKAFNSYDPEYVEGTGRRWKVRINSDNWLDSYYINPGKKMSMHMMSDPYYNLGAYLQYMAVSVGYSFDISHLIEKGKPNHNKFEYSFNCARFNLEGHYWENTRGTYIRKFTGFDEGRLIKKFFKGTSLYDFEICGYYFFNNKKFSMGAAYNYSKFQRKSAGSPIIGFGYTNLNISVDLNALPEELYPALTIPADFYRFHYRSYSIISGYTYNWVIHRNLLFNISAFPGVGLSVTYADNSEGMAKLTALNLRARASLTYNLKDFFICAVAKMDGNWYLSGRNTFFSSVENAQLSIGWRF